MKFQYVCDHEDAPKRTKVFGIYFELGGAAVEVKDEAVALKLLGNPSFKAIEKAAKEPKEVVKAE
jgi:hypothetical protein